MEFQMEIDGKVAVVTGGGSGIGRCTAELLASLGVRVVLSYARSRAAAEDAVAAIRAAGGSADAVQADVRDDTACRALMQSAVDTYGALHILVNNAGTTHFIPHADLEGVTDEAWDDIFDTNVRGTFYCTRAAVPHMRAAGEGAIVNVASSAGVIAGGSSIPYGASKAAVISMTRHLGRVLAPEIRINAIAPGFVDTPWLTRGLGDGYEDFVRTQSRRNPMGRIATPESVASSIVALIRDHTFVTGQTLVLDGGASL